MTADLQVSVFQGGRIVARGAMTTLNAVLQPLLAGQSEEAVLVFDDSSGRQIDPDFRANAPAPAAPQRGRPKLGVVAKEVTLLPRHWEWLASQPGGASAALRRLVEDARKSNAGKDARRAAQASCFAFLNAIAGNYPSFEEVLRALYGDDREKMAALMQDWPSDVAAYALALAFPQAANGALFEDE